VIIRPMIASHRAASTIKKCLSRHPWHLSVVREMCRIYLLAYLFLRLFLKMNLSVLSQMQ